MSQTTNKNELVHVGLVDFKAIRDLLDGFEGTMGEILVKLLETHMGKEHVEVDTLEYSVNLDGGLGSREGMLAMFAGSMQMAEGMGVWWQVLLIVTLEVLDKVVHETDIKVLIAQVSITGYGLCKKWYLCFQTLDHPIGPGHFYRGSSCTGWRGSA